MRFAIAIAVLVLSGVAFLLGIGQRTFLAPAAERVLTVSETTDAGYAVIPAEAFAAQTGAPSVTVLTDGAFAAVGAQRDVDAWVEPLDHIIITAAAGDDALAVESVAALPPASDGRSDAAADEEPAPTDEPAVLDPRGSDLWLVEYSADPLPTDDDADAPAVTQLKLRMPVDVEPGQAVIVASTSGDSLANGVSIAWTQDQRTPFAGPLLVTGAVLAVLGAVLLVLAIDHDRRGLGPRRGRTGLLPGIRGSIAHRRQTRKLQRIAAPALVVTAALAVSGCSPAYWPDFSPEATETIEVETLPDPSLAPVPITPGQIDRIIADVVTVAEAADESLDVTLLESRLTADALAQRAANYKIRAAVPDYDLVPPKITGEELGYELVQSTEGWPRTVFVAVGSTTDSDLPEAEAEGESDDGVDGAETETADDEVVPSSSPSLALIMTQAGPHENYLVSRVITLRGGIAMPEAAPAEEGTALLAPDLQTLVLPPGEVGPAFAALLQGGPDVAEAELFDLGEDPLVSKSGYAWLQQVREKAAADDVSVEYSVTARQTDEPITALSTGVGGALVAVTVLEERIADTAGSTYRLRAEGAVSALSGLSGQQERIVSEVAHQLLFFIPSKASGDKIQLLGATSELVGARN